jgi:hypothetical protein
MGFRGPQYTATHPHDLRRTPSQPEFDLEFQSIFDGGCLPIPLSPIHHDLPKLLAGL